MSLPHNNIENELKRQAPLPIAGILIIGCDNSSPIPKFLTRCDLGFMTRLNLSAAFTQSSSLSGLKRHHSGASVAVTVTSSSLKSFRSPTISIRI